jgi:uncharacterized DUF497 family protein
MEGSSMRFEWDETKRRSNLKKHGLDFDEVTAIFNGPTYTILDDRTEYGEDRFVTFGLFEGFVIVVVHTEIDELIRIISARKAKRHEEKQYFSEISQ